jgi:hypothetical protein
MLSHGFMYPFDLACPVRSGSFHLLARSNLDRSHKAHRQFLLQFVAMITPCPVVSKLSEQPQRERRMGVSDCFFLRAMTYSVPQLEPNRAAVLATTKQPLSQQLEQPSFVRVTRMCSRMFMP